MLSTIASFFWGQKASAPLPEPEVNPSNIKDDVIHDIITDDGIANDARSSGTVLSTSSLSDEEAGWVFVNSKQDHTDSNASEKESEPLENDPPLPKKERKPKDNVPATKPKNIPSSALHTSSVLNALAELRPQQKANRRRQESRLKHKQMERSNKALHVCSSSNRPNRRRFMYSPERSSRAVNNRKC